MKLTEDEYCERFKSSKDILSSRIKAKKVESIVEDGIKYISTSDKSMNSADRVEPSKEVISSSNHMHAQKSKVTVAMVLALYHKENTILKQKISRLEKKIDRLVDEKEQILRDELNKLESFYSVKDRQLKNILELVNNKVAYENKELTVHEVESCSEFSNDSVNNEHELVELKEYLKLLGLKSAKRKIIKKRFLDLHDGDVRIIEQEGKIYLDFSRYDYSDLLA